MNFSVELERSINGKMIFFLVLGSPGSGVNEKKGKFLDCGDMVVQENRAPENAS